MLKVCGHVMCKTCASSFCKENCQKCDSKVGIKGMIQLKETGSGYASHSKVEVKVY